LIQTGKRSNYLLAPVVLLLIVGCGGKNTSESSATCKQGCYRGHGVSFSYPPKWRKTQDLEAPISELWYLTLVLESPSDYVEVYGQGQSELDFPAANLAAGKALLQNQRKAAGAYVLPGSTKLTIDGRPGLRFRTRQSRGSLLKRGKTIENTIVITSKGKTQYRIDCFHLERAAEIERGCAQIVRTFKVD
jgi:hypothetical protein